MRRAIRDTVALGGILCWIGAATAAGQEEALAAVPSGLTLALMDQRIEPQSDGSDWARFRFLAPALATGVSYDAVEGDFAHLCTEYALPDLKDRGAEVAQVVISLSSKELEFGETQPDIIQFFEAFRVENGLCIWEAF
ncbi:DUF6497 family protein [Thalassobius sp. MITS945101]|uniref:DUF6497 family protein n=1 Tax=Thalassobius sp. MITS945101 TaxID=3096994 RepID=UPI00399A06DC